MTLAMYFGWFDPLYLLLAAPGMILAMWAQARVKSAYAAGSQMRASSDVTGAEAAQMILHAHNIMNVGIEHAHGGTLSDHYDPKSRVLRLSDGVYDGRSVAALGIAAHEAGHAVQHAVGYAPLGIRNAIVPMAAIGTNFSFLMVIIGGMLASMRMPFGMMLVWGGLGFFSLAVIFQLINLPVEYDASRRAKDLLKSSGLVAEGPEARAMSRVLNAAALTYVAATLSAIMMLIYLIMRSGVLNDRR